MQKSYTCFEANPDVWRDVNEKGLKLLAEKDTINLRKVVTKEAFKSFNFKQLGGLQKLGVEWKAKKANVYSSTEFVEVVKVEGFYTMLNFVRESNSNEWKFSTFGLPCLIFAFLTYPPSTNMCLGLNVNKTT